MYHHTVETVGQAIRVSDMLLKEGISSSTDFQSNGWIRFVVRKEWADFLRNACLNSHRRNVFARSIKHKRNEEHEIQTTRP